MNAKINPLLSILILILVGIFFFFLFSSEKFTHTFNEIIDWWEESGTTGEEFFYSMTDGGKVLEVHNKLGELEDKFVIDYNQSQSKQERLLAVRGHVRNLNRLDTDGLPSDYKENLYLYIDKMDDLASVIAGSLFPDISLIEKLMNERSEILIRFRIICEGHGLIIENKTGD